MAGLLTRPLADSQRIAGELHAYGIQALIWPLTRISWTDGPLKVPSHVDALVFSSAHAIRAFCSQSTPRDLPVFCVGQRTAELARQHGFKDVTAAGGTFDALVATICAAKPCAVLYLRGRDVIGDMTSALAAHGIDCISQIVYAAEPAGPPEHTVTQAFQAGSIEAITIWSRRNADLLDESIRARSDWKIADSTVIAISDNAAAPLGSTGFRRIIVASRPNATQMIAEIRAALR